MGMFKNDDDVLEKIDMLIKNNINEVVANSINFYLEPLRNILDKEQKLISDATSKAVEKLDQYSEVSEILQSLIKENKKMSKVVLDLHKEIQKRDAIIHRKDEQISRLKKA